MKRVDLRRCAAGGAGALIATLLCGCAGMSGLHPVTPNEPAGSGAWTVSVDARDPVLRWQAFPREIDARLFGSNMRERITNVRYDLKLWPPQGGGWCAAPTVVKGLPKPEYKLGIVTPGQIYRWAARACFDLDGKPRVTQWTTITPRPLLWDSPAEHPMLKTEEHVEPKKVAGL